MSICDPNTYPPIVACANTLIPAHPSYPDFKAYGGALAYKEFAEQPNAGFVLSNMGKAILITVGVGAAVAVAGGLIASTVVSALPAGSSFVAIFTAAAASDIPAIAGAAPAIAAAGSVVLIAVAVLAIVLFIIGAVLLADFDRIPTCLKEDIKIAVGMNVSPRQCSEESTQKSKPNLVALFSTKEGKQEISLAFAAATLPEAQTTTNGPAPQTTPLWAVADQSRTPLPSESGQLLHLTSWPDANGHDTFLDVGLYNGWFVAQIPQAGGGTKNILTLGVEFINPDGQKWTVSRMKCAADATECTPGEPLFLFTRNGEQPPTGLSNEAFVAWIEKADTEITYTDANGHTRIASLHTAPTVSGFLSTGDLKEGTQLSLSASSTPPSAALAWDFGDGDTGSGSPVLHTFKDDGTFDIKVTATDTFGSSSEGKTFPLTIANVAPTATFTFPTEVNEGSPIALALTTPFDPSAADTTAGFQYSLSCGAGFAFGVTPALSCPTTDNGTRTVSGKIRDKDNGVTEYEGTVQVKNVPPTATFTVSPTQLFLGESATLTFTNPTDPSSADTAAGFAYSFDCTNDSTLEVTGSPTPSFGCKYTKAGNITARGLIADKDHDRTAYTTTVTVLSPQQAADLLRSQVLALKAQKVLSRKETETLLTAKFNDMIDKYGPLMTTPKGKDPATTILQTFIAQVKTFMTQGVLSAAQGQGLLDLATRVLASVAAS